MLALLAGLYGLHITAVRDGHDWGGDFSLYILHAKNVAEGKPYTQTPWIYNPNGGWDSPRAYPPVFPWWLSPFYAWRGLDFPALKLASSVFILLAWLALYGLARGALRWPESLVLIGLVAAHPGFWQLRLSILPDALCMFVTLGALACWEWMAERGWSLSHPLAMGAAAASLAAIAYESRNLGVMLVPAFALAELRRRRQITWLHVTLGTVFLVCVGTINWAARIGEGSYLKLVVWDPKVVAENAIEYARSLNWVWSNGYSRAAQYAVTAVFSAAAAIGAADRWKRGTGATEIYVALYMALLMWWNFSGMRYLLPVVPIYFFYVVVGLSRVADKLDMRRVPVAALAAVAGLSYAGRYATMPAPDPGIQTPSFVELCEFVRSQTRPDDGLVFWNPRVLALMTGRRATRYSRLPDRETDWSFFGQSRIGYLVLAKSREDDRALMGPLVERHAGEASRVWSNSEYDVFRVVR